MNLSCCQTRPSVVVLESTGKWENAIKLACPEMGIKPLPNLEHLANQLSRKTGLIAIIEIPTELPLLMERLKFVGFNATNPSQPCFVGVVDDKLSDLKKEISQFGFCEVFDNLFQMARLLPLAHNHWKSVSWPNTSIEQRVQNSLPWLSDDQKTNLK